MKYKLYGVLALSAGNQSLRNAQIVKSVAYAVVCNNTGATLDADNLLIHRVNSYAIYGGAAIRARHLTVHQANYLRNGGSWTLSLTNSLLVSVTNWGGAFTSVNNATNSSGAGVFQTVGAAQHYLAAGSTNRNAGVTNLSAAPGLRPGRQPVAPAHAGWSHPRVETICWRPAPPPRKTRSPSP